MNPGFSPRPLLGAILICLFSVAASTETQAAGKRLLMANWETAPTSRGWNVSSPTNVTFLKPDASPTYLHVVSRDPGVMSQGATYDLPINQVRGTIVDVGVEIRAKNVTKPLHSCNGIKFLVHTTSASVGDAWPAADANGPFFPVNHDWTPARFEAIIPETATEATLVLGLQESLGEVDFRNLQVSIARSVAYTSYRTPLGSPYTGHGSGSLRGVMISPDISPSDVDTLKTWHVNLVRWQLVWSGFPRSPADTASIQAYDAWLNGSLLRLDRMLPIFDAAGIKVVIDMHTPPGGRDASDEDRIFEDQAMQTHFVECWKAITKRFRDRHGIWGYDLVNEPVTGNLGPGLLDWHDLAERTAMIIRAIDPKHAIIVEPAPWASVDALPFFPPIHVPGVVYSVHFYLPMPFTHQGVLADLPVGPAYPGRIEGQQWDQARIRAAFQPVADYAKKFNVQIYVGEFSAARWAAGSDQYITDVISVLEDNHWDWSYHAFREWQGWDPEYGTDRASSKPDLAPTARLRILKTAFAKDTAGLQ